MTKLRFAVIVWIAWSLIGCASQDSSAMPPPSPATRVSATPDVASLVKLSSGLFLEPDKNASVTLPVDPMVLRSRLVRLNSDLLASLVAPQPASPPSNPRNAPLNLFPDALYTAVADRVELNPKGFVWLGHLDGIASSQVTLVVENNTLSGTIRLPGKLYLVRFAGNGLYFINEVDPRAFPPD